jgi:hypothetical protein
VKKSKTSKKHSEARKYFAQVHSSVSKAVLRVEYEKGDRVGELVEVVCRKWGIQNKRGWFPALIVPGYGWQLYADDDIPTDLDTFIREHEEEFAWDKWDAKRRGLKKFRQYGDLIRGASIEVSVSSEDTPTDWASTDIHILFVVGITGG